MITRIILRVIASGVSLRITIGAVQLDEQKPLKVVTFNCGIAGLRRRLADIFSGCNPAFADADIILLQECGVKDAISHEDADSLETLLGSFYRPQFSAILSTDAGILFLSSAASPITSQTGPRWAYAQARLRPLGPSSAAITAVDLWSIHGPLRECLPFWSTTWPAARDSLSKSADTIIGADWNAVPDPSRDSLMGTPGSCPWSLVGPALTPLGIQDTYRSLCPEGRSYSRIALSRTGSIRSAKRIDSIWMSSRLQRFARHPRFAPTSSDHHAVAISLAIDVAFTPPTERHERPWTLHPGLLHDPQFRSSVLAAVTEMGPPMPPSPSLSRVTQWQDYICRLRDVCRNASIPAGRRLKALRNSVVALERQVSALSLTNELDLRQLPILLSNLQAARRMADEAVKIGTTSRRIPHAFHPTSWLETALTRTGGSHSIRALRDVDGGITSDPDRMLTIVHAFFSDLYSEPPLSPIHDWGRDLLRAHARTKFLPEDVLALDAPFSLEEVTLALRHANVASSPGPLGLTYPLLTLTAETTGPHILSLAEGLRDGESMPVLLQTSLLHKKGVKIDLTMYRPISVSDTALRTVTRMAARRLQTAAGHAMPWTQAAFMPGRRTSSIAGALQGILDHLWLGRNPACQSIVVLLLDQQKAYDRVGHSWLWDIMGDAGTPASFTRLVQALYSNPSLQVMVNGRLTDLVHLLAGLLQGDSLSCALYNLSLQPLQDLLASFGVGIHIDGLGLVTSLAFADDLAVLLPGNAIGAAQWPLVMSALQAYEAASGARLNRTKSGFLEISTDMGVGSAPLRAAMAADGFTSLPTSNNELIHLGHPIHVAGPAGPCRLAFDARIEAMGTRINQLQKTNTDLIIRVRLCNSLITPKLWHHTSVGGLPPTARSLISGATHSYLFLGDRPWFSTATLSAPRHLGGLGLIHPDHMFTAQSIAFLSHNLLREDAYGEWLRLGLGWHLHHIFKCSPAALLIPGGSHRKTLMLPETRAMGFWGRLLHALASVDVSIDDSWLSLPTPALLELPWYLDKQTPPLPASWTAKDFASLATRGWITWGDILWKASNSPRVHSYSPSWPLGPPCKASAAA
ncbi:hypothetical protein CF326_g7330, partial [Tilletia indica]